MEPPAVPVAPEIGPQTVGRSNRVGAATSVPKLNGVVYTPLPLAREIVARLPLDPALPGDPASPLAGPAPIWLDPACGEAVFLIAAMERARAAGAAIRLEGWDVDGPALQRAAAQVDRVASELSLDPACCALVHRDALVPEPRRFDAVVGNPPYLESKRMPEPMKDRLRARCPISATGAFDLYAAFVELGARLLRPGGTLSLLVPNRLSVVSCAAALRRWLADHGRITAIDLSRADPFPDAAVYPMVLEWTATLDLPGADLPGADLVASDLPGSAICRFPRALIRDRLSERWPLPADPATGALAAAILDRRLPALGDAFDVRWSVSFHASGLRDRYVYDHRPDSPHARRFLGGGRFAGNREVQPHRITWAGSWIDYDEDRARRDRNPLPPLSLFTAPKVVICQNARRCRAAVDAEGFILKDTFLAAVPRPDTPAPWLWWLPLVLHSRAFHLCYEALNGGTRKGGGYLHFLGGYLSAAPLPPPPPGADPEALYRAAQDGSADSVEIERIVCRAFGLTAAEEAVVMSATVPPF